MNYYPSKCNPCRLCGSRPELVSVGYGRNHDDILCSKPGCGQRVDVDGSEKQCCKAWNAQNPIAPRTAPNVRDHRAELAAARSAMAVLATQRDEARAELNNARTLTEATRQDLVKARAEVEELKGRTVRLPGAVGVFIEDGKPAHGMENGGRYLIKTDVIRMLAAQGVEVEQ
jgi:hypothetical protein